MKLRLTLDVDYPEVACYDLTTQRSALIRTLMDQLVPLVRRGVMNGVGVSGWVCLPGPFRLEDGHEATVIGSVEPDSPIGSVEPDSPTQRVASPGPRN